MGSDVADSRAKRDMDILQSFFNEGGDSELLDGPQELSELSGQGPFAIDSSIPSTNLGGAGTCDAAATDATLWEDPFCVTTTAINSTMMEAEASGDVVSGSSDMQLSDSMSAPEGSPDDMGILAKALDFSETQADGFGEGLADFALANSSSNPKDALPTHANAPHPEKKASGQGVASDSCEEKTRAQSHGSPVEHRSPKVEGKDGDIESTHSSDASRGTPRDKTTQRKLRNKESARRYREKQVAKRRQLENFTRNLADQNQQLEMLHDKLLSLTCAPPGGRPGPQTSTTPLQDINN